VVVPAVPRTLVLASFLAACTFDGQFVSGYQCGVGGSCPSGFQCVADVCTSEEGGGDVDAGDGLDTDSDPAADAGQWARFSDDFSDGVLDGWIPWGHPGCTVDEIGGMVQLDYTGIGESYCGIDTEQSFDLRIGSVTVEVAETPSRANFETYVILFSSDNEQQILMTHDNGDLVMQVRVLGSVVASLTIDDPGHRFWRIHREGPMTIWETSADGASWQLRHTTAQPVDASAMAVELAGGHYLPGTGTAERIRFDRLVVE
jgi:hypothetical protein